MNSLDKSLDHAMNEILPDGSARILGGRDSYMEILENATGTIWMALEPGTKNDLFALDLGDEYTPLGAGLASMDAAAFLHSPNLANQPVVERNIGGRRFINNAHPPSSKIAARAGDGSMMRIEVNKAHVLGFEAGRTVAVIKLPEGDYVECIGSSDSDDELTLPEGGSIEHFNLTQPWIVHLPVPTTALWWGFGSGKSRSFQGPIAHLPKID